MLLVRVRIGRGWRAPLALGLVLMYRGRGVGAVCLRTRGVLCSWWVAGHCRGAVSVVGGLGARFRMALFCFAPGLWAWLAARVVVL